MILGSLTAENFRNLAPHPVAFHTQTNLVVGRNGQGKTNLLEAIYFLATTPGPTGWPRTSIWRTLPPKPTFGPR